MFEQQRHVAPGSLIASMLDEDKPPAEFLKGRGHVETAMPSTEDALKYCLPLPCSYNCRPHCTGGGTEAPTQSPHREAPGSEPGYSDP